MDIEINIKEVFEALNTKIFKEIQKFVHDIVFYDAQLELYLSPKARNISSTGWNGRASKQLRTAFLRLRNVDSDHSMTFIQLKIHLRNGICYVVDLISSNFLNKGGVGAPLHNMIRQITGISPDTAHMDVLAAWYRAESSIKRPIAIIIEDSELCNSMVLAKFIVILSEWIAELPLVLIMGMATSGEAICKLLPSSAARHLHVHNFMFLSPDDYLKGIIEGVLLKPLPLFTMSCDALAFLLSQYLECDGMVTSFIRALKMACMEHFISQPLSFLCTSFASNPNQALTEPHLHYASGLPSLQSKQSRTDSENSDKILRAVDKLRAQKARWNSTVLVSVSRGRTVCLVM